MSFIKEFSGNIQGLLRSFKNEPEAYWHARGTRAALDLFHDTALRVPAYADFLTQHNVEMEGVTDQESFCALPVTSKQNYLQAYPLEKLAPDGIFAGGNWVIASTSGSTGEPFYFPRTKLQDDQFALTAEAVFVDFYKINERSTLFINCFALGVWIGGMFMHGAIKKLADDGKYQLAIIAPGADKTEALKAIKRLGAGFDQVVLGGYAPLVKDLIDDGIRQGIDWSAYSMNYFFAAEGFTEGLRDYIATYGGVKNIFLGTINHYGTADLGTMANETPVSILVRRLAAANPDLFADLFGQSTRLPTLAQFVPELYFFEEVDGRLVCSSRGGLPLVRYDLKDRGGVLSFDTVVQKCSNHGIVLQDEIAKYGLEDLVWNLPFVYLYERDDMTVSIYSVNIYPETIRKALEVPDLGHSITGKFTMKVDYDEEQNQYLEINIELKPDKEKDQEFEERTLGSIVAWLDKENSEWRDFYADPGIRHKVLPRLIYWSYQDPLHFHPGRKQKWVKK